MAAPEELDLEAIGAFIDGKLTGAERDRVVKLLDESSAAFEVYAGALQARLDVDPPTVIPLPSPRRNWRWKVVSPVLAAAALLIAVIPRLNVGGDPVGMIAATIVAPLTASSATAGAAKGQVELAAALGPGWDQQSWSVMRGGGSARVDSTAALRLGVRATDLQVALVVGDRELAARMAGEMVGLLGPIDLSDAQRADYDAIRTRITAGDSLKQIMDAASRADASLGGFLKSPWFGFGKWFGAGELAARAGSTSFFASSQTKKFIESAMASGRLAPEDVERLREVGVLTARGASEQNFKTVQEKFAELIQRHGG